MTLQFSLSGFSGRITEGTCEVISFDGSARRKRAWVALGRAWGVAVACVFIPVAHFLLVPSFLAFGIYQFIERLGTAEVYRETRGTCPDCGTQQAFELRAGQAQITCEQCHRGLVVTFTVPS